MRSAEIKERALEAGFDLAGVASLDDPALGVAETRYRRWLDKGHAASMDYLGRHAELKSHPERLLPGAKSVVCVGLLYAPDEAAAAGKNQARVSVYTRGPDYHAVMGERLASLRAWIESNGVAARPFVDAEPVFERFWAWRAGLGWLGRNSVLINRRLGSYLFLGGLLVATELEADESGVDHCGRCRKCIDACPTVAINDDREVDSGKCIAYHTIENRGRVPEAVMAATGLWVAGCDICQAVCPWNDPVTPGPAFESSNPVYDADLRQLARWDEGEFKAKTARVAMARMKYSMFLRNVSIAVANSDLSEDEKKDALASLGASAARLADGPGREGALLALAWALREMLEK